MSRLVWGVAISLFTVMLGVGCLPLPPAAPPNTWVGGPEGGERETLFGLEAGEAGRHAARMAVRLGRKTVYVCSEAGLILESVPLGRRGDCLLARETLWNEGREAKVTIRAVCPGRGE